MMALVVEVVWGRRGHWSHPFGGGAEGVAGLLFASPGTGSAVLVLLEGGPGGVLTALLCRVSGVQVLSAAAGPCAGLVGLRVVLEADLGTVAGRQFSSAVPVVQEELLHDP